MIVASFLSLLVFGLLDNFRGPFYSAQLQEFGLDESTGAALFGFTSCFASLASFFGSRLMIRLGPKGLLQLSSLLMAIGFLVMSLAPQVLTMLFGAAVFGMGLGFATIAQNYSVSEYSNVNQRNRNLSGLHAMYGLSSMIAPYLAHSLMLMSWSWRQSYAAVALLPIFLIVVNAITLRSKNDETNATHSKSPRLSPAARFHAFTLGLAMALYLLAEISLGTRMVRWLEIKYGMTAVTGSLYLTGFFCALLLGRLFTWIVSPKHFKGLRWSLLGTLFLSFVLLTIGWLFNPLWAVLSGLTLGPFYPLAVGYVRVRLHLEVAAALSLIMSMGSATVVIMHFSIGILADHFGIQNAMIVGPIGLILALLILLLEFGKKWGTVGESNALN